MIKKFFVGILFFYNIVAFTQGQADNWYFGYSAGVNFSGTAPVNISNSGIQLNTEEGCSAFSDSAGNTLFYSDGNTVWDKNNNPIPGGSNLLGSASSTQSAMVIPRPGSTTEYYLFTVGSVFNNDTPGFNYYTIDMSLNGGLGAISGSVVNLSGSYSANWSEKVAAVQGADCDTYWVVSYDGVNIQSFKVDASGVETTPRITSAPASEYNRRGYLKISPDGKKLAIAHYNYYDNDPNGDGSAYLYDFDDTNGTVSNSIRLFNDATFTEHPYGLEFSRQSSKLYTSTFDGISNNVYQYDLTSTNIPNSEIQVHSQLGYRGALQIGRNGKIYATVPVDYWTGTSYLDVINNPDEAGTACDYQEDDIDLGTGKASQGLPPFIASIFSPIEIVGDDGSGNNIVLNGLLVDLCVGDDLTINPEPLTGTATYEWSFNDTVLSTNEQLSLTNLSTSDIGEYKLEVTSIDACGRQSYRQGFFSINNVMVPPVVNVTPPQVVCDPNYNGSFAFDFDAQYTSIILDGQDPAIYEVFYFISQANADSNTDPLPTPYDAPNITIYARIQNRNNTNCYVTTSFDITIFKSALPLDVSNIPALSHCDDISFGTLNDKIIITDLTQNETVILNGQLPSEFTVTYYTDVNYIDLIPDPTAFQNPIAGGQTIYVRVTNNLQIECYTDTSFDLEIFTQPVASIAPTIVLCDDDNNGTMPFTLTDQGALITADLGMTISYHASQNDADLNANTLVSPFESRTTTIFARIENPLKITCYDTTSFDIEVYESAFPLDSSQIPDLSFCDNNSVGTDTDGLALFDLDQRKTEILNGQSAIDFTLTYYTDANYVNLISSPSAFQNTAVNGQTIYVRMTNNLQSTCYSDTSFNIEVFELPTIQSSMLFQNCDEDGLADGFTDFNLDEANDYITNNDANLTVTYHLSMTDANAGSSDVNPSPFNNTTANTVYARIETPNGCHRVSTINLQVSTTSFPAGYSYDMETCDDDDTIDGLHLFDLTQASSDMIAQFPTGQNLEVKYYRNVSDAQLEKNEISDQANYLSETAYNQTLYVRVESNDNGACYGIGPFLNLTVYARPEFEVIPEATVCVNLSAITIAVFNPSGSYDYVWTDQSNNVISTSESVAISTGGVYTVIATSGSNCTSFPHTVTIIESDIATIDYDDVTIKDDSDNNIVNINNENNNLGIGDYEFSLDDEFGPYQDESLFDRVAPGIHTIYIRDKNSCGLAILEISVVGFPKFFTPNNDGQNDTWQVLGVDQNFFPTSIIHIYDRFGKIIAKVNPISEGWNGYYNGSPLPSDDYWFSVQLVDKDGNSRNRKGHFSLIRR